MITLPDTLAFAFWLLHRARPSLTKKTDINLKKWSPQYQLFWGDKERS